jgi:uncharacterized protein YggT (Ycf19 family)
MGLLDFILNLAGVLIWLNWRALRFDPLSGSTPASLVGTLRRAEPRRSRRWYLLGVLLVLLVARALLYCQLGPAVSWAPSLRLGATAIFFRSDFLNRMLLFSFFSFGLALGMLYLWLLLISLVNGRAVDGELSHRLLRVHLGRVQGWPWPVKLALPLCLSVIFWLGAGLLLVHFNIIPAAPSTRLRVEQGFVLGLGAYLLWKYLIAAVLALYLISSYIYFGDQPFWRFVTSTSRNLLLPLRWLPLKLGKLDFAPILVIALVFLAAGLAERWLAILYVRLPL